MIAAIEVIHGVALHVPAPRYCLPNRPLCSMVIVKSVAKGYYLHLAAIPVEIKAPHAHAVYDDLMGRCWRHIFKIGHKLNSHVEEAEFSFKLCFLCLRRISRGARCR